jgi:hypothetical protein
MLDWEAPTGGYLLQASFATGAAAGGGALEWLEHRFSRRSGDPKRASWGRIPWVHTAERLSKMRTTQMNKETP